MLPRPPRRLRSRLVRVRRAVLRRRRPLAALAAGVAVAAGVHAVAAPPPPRVPVVVAAHDLPAGSVVEADDVTEVGFAPGTEPDGLSARPVGRTVATAVRRGEPLTDARLVTPALSSTLATAGRTALPLRLPDPGTAGLLSTGDHIDLVATDPQTGETSTVASDAVVLGLPRTSTETGQPTGALLVVGVLPSEVTAVSGAAARAFLSYAFAR